VPYLVRGGERFFDRTEVREAILLLRGAGRAATTTPPPARPTWSPTCCARGCRWQPTRRPPGPVPTRERWESLAALHRLAGDLARPLPDAGLRELVAELEERASASTPRASTA
jgi:DNA helicase-2/ATP-dependent DNA helicase PcrA